MHKTKFFISLILAVSILMVQTGGVFAAPAIQAFPSISGIVQTITVETDSATGITTVLVTVMDDNQVFQTVRISQKTAEKLGLVVPDNDGKPVINQSALGQSVEIKLKAIIPDQEEGRHPVGNALATFFVHIEGLDYDTIMLAHNDETGFGVIAQALWLTTKLEGNVDVFQSLLLAKETGDYEDFTFDDGTTPKNWAELRKGLMDGKKLQKLGDVMSTKNDGNGNNPEKNKEKGNKDKSKEKEKEKEKSK